MNSDKRSELLRDLTPEIEKTGRSWYVVFGILLLVFLTGIYG